LGGIDQNHASSILPSRVFAYQTRQDAYLPILPDEFEFLYETLRGNLRAALGYADNYCMWIADRTPPATDDEKKSCFFDWLNQETKKEYTAVKDQMPPRTVQVFRTAVDLGGEFSPSDHDAFDFTSSQVLRPHVKTLEDLGLVSSQRDDIDKRRKTISVTPKGWLVFHALEAE
jgi:hypothetical protein